MTRAPALLLLLTAAAVLTWRLWPEGRRQQRSPVSAAKTLALKTRGAAVANVPSILKSPAAQDWLDEDRQGELLSALLEWAPRNPPEAMALAEGLPTEIREMVQRELAGALMSSAPRESLQLLAALPQCEWHDQLLRQAALQYAAARPEQALEWAKTQPDTEVRSIFMGAVVCEMASRDPRQAMRTALEELPPGQARDRAIIETVQLWSQRAPSEAAAFVSTFEDEAMPAAVEALIIQWRTEDPSAAKQWIFSVQNPGIKSAAEEVMARHLPL